MSYGDEWRAQRRLAHMALSPKAVQKYQPLLEDYAARTATGLLDDPGEFYHHIKQYAGLHMYRPSVVA